jgi:hypothetical protein
MEEEMSLLRSIIQRKKPEVFNPIPDEIRKMPARPFRVMHADLPFYSDARCQNEIPNARLVILQCVDTIQKRTDVECMPSRKRYQRGQTVSWDLNNKLIWQSAWYRNPDTAQIEKAWTQSVEFVGKVVAADVVAVSAKPKQASASHQ